MTLSISDYVETSLTTPEAKATFSIGSIAIFTDEIVFTEDFRIYTSIDGIINNFGITSKTYKMAEVMFKQQINFKLTDGARLVIIPIKATTGTRGYFKTADLAPNLTALQAISDGDLQITIDGVVNTLTKIDFTKIKNVEDIITVLEKKKLPLDYKIDATSIDILSKNVGSDSSVVVEQLSGGTGTDLSVSGLFNTSGGTAVAGVDETITKGIIETLAEIKNDVVITLFTTTLELNIDKVISIQQSIGNNFIFVYNIPNKDDFVKIKEGIYDVAGGFKKVLNFIPFTGLTDELNGQYMRSAIVSQLAGNDTYKRKKRTLHAKSLQGVDIVNQKGIMNQTIKDLANDNGIHIYGYYSQGKGSSIFYSGKPYEPETLVNFLNLQEISRVYLANQLSDKTINKTNAELQVVRKEYEKHILEKFKINSVFSVLDPAESFDITFGNIENARDSLESKGYYSFIPNVSDISGKSVPIQVAVKISEIVLQFKVEIASLN
jgi:hypothetical protein